ncbi:hypothetical protein C7S18_15795 [Ahniella affigens]|uniref:Sel1 repeat family protein n=2 Tax=Ahniella affigens TaxID=2021234 RepID=A0A2P1PUP7_9GAMM|nr:hypothetical protein C7S18_15795 [Ahniella affigens]
MLAVLGSVAIWGSRSVVATKLTSTDTVIADPKLGHDESVLRAKEPMTMKQEVLDQTSTEGVSASKQEPLPSSPRTALFDQLPDNDTPLSISFPDLKRRAEQGDVKANCRLGIDLAKCTFAQEATKASESVVRDASSSRASASQVEQRVTEAAELAERGNQFAKLCEGFEIPRDVTPWKYQLRAAQAGHVPSMVRFAIQPPLSESMFGSELDGWKAYQENAGNLLRIAAARGDRTAYYYLHWIYAGYPTSGGVELLPPNDSLALAYALASLQSVDAQSRPGLQRSIDRLRARMSAQQIAEAQAHVPALASVPSRSNQGINIDQNLVPDDSDECRDLE